MKLSICSDEQQSAREKLAAQAVDDEKTLIVNHIGRLQVNTISLCADDLIHCINVWWSVGLQYAHCT